MNQHIPYFYIIRHISTGKMYAGSRWGKNCHPDDLLVTYKTHSNKIKNIIKTEGIKSFDILRTDSYCDGLHPYEYEKSFLEINNWIIIFQLVLKRGLVLFPQNINLRYPTPTNQDYANKSSKLPLVFSS